MITRFASLSGRLLTAIAVLFTLSACGGGGGGGNSDVGFLPDGGSGTKYRITLSLTDANGDATDTVTPIAPVTLTALVTKGGNKNPVEGVVIEVETTLGILLPEDGTALTDIEGIATIQIAAGEDRGAGTATVTVENPNGGDPFTATISFQVGQSGLRIGNFTDGVFIDGEIGITAGELAVGGSALLRVDVVDENGDLATNPEMIKLKSGCSLSGLAELPGEVETVNGQATATYTAAGCGGEDEITATLFSNGSVATATLDVAPPEADVIEFVSVDPESSVIALKGTGTASRPETATVSFRVISGASSPDNPGTALPGVQVEFGISTDVGGIKLQNTSGITDSNGIVKASLQSGNIATSVTITAIIILEDGEEGPSTASKPIVVSTGLPDQDSISISTSALNVQGALNFDGKTAEITVRMADKFRNPVADGTSAVFTTEYGSIESSCVTVGGACTVTWTSQAPRFPVFNQDLVRTIEYSESYDCLVHNGINGPCGADLGAIRGLRTTILVTALGEETFFDTNGNGVYDRGEPFDNLPEAFLDANEDGVYTPLLGPQCPIPSTPERCAAAGAEEEGKYIDLNGDGQYSLNNSPEWYNGSLCPAEGDGVWCSRELVNVRAQIVLVMSAESEFEFLLVGQLSRRVLPATDQGDRFWVYISDFYNNSPAGGVKVEVSGSGNCEILTPTEFTVPDSNGYGAFRIPLETKGDGSGESGIVTVSAGDNASRTFGCRSPVVEETPEGGADAA